MIQNTVLSKLVVVFVLGLGLILGGAGIAKAEYKNYPGERLQKQYPSWKDQCYGVVKWKTNGRHKFVNRQFKIINKTLDNWTFVKVRQDQPADIKVKFRSPERIEKVSNGEWVGIVWYDYFYSGTKKTFSDARAVVPRSGFGWKTVTAHEIWHTVGVAHVPQKYRPSLMNPYLDRPTIYGWYPDAEDFRLLRTVDNKC